MHKLNYNYDTTTGSALGASIGAHLISDGGTGLLMSAWHRSIVSLPASGPSLSGERGITTSVSICIDNSIGCPIDSSYNDRRSSISSRGSAGMELASHYPVCDVIAVNSHNQSPAED